MAHTRTRRLLKCKLHYMYMVKTSQRWNASSWWSLPATLPGVLVPLCSFSVTHQTPDCTCSQPSHPDFTHSQAGLADTHIRTHARTHTCTHTSAVDIMTPWGSLRLAPIIYRGGLLRRATLYVHVHMVAVCSPRTCLCPAWQWGISWWTCAWSYTDTRHHQHPTGTGHL